MIQLQYVWIRNYESPRTIAEHRHTCYEFIYYLKGTGRGFAGEEKYDYSPGTFVLVETGVPHGETHETRTSMISVGFRLQNHFENPKSGCFRDVESQIFDIAQTIRHEFKQKNVYYQQAIENLLGRIVIEILRRTSTAVQKSQNIDYAIAYIREYYMSAIDLDELARSTGYCEDHFRIVFRKKTGLSPKEFILETRLNAAKKLLADPALSLSDIAFKCGYEYYSQFSLFFKRRTSLTPSEYRASLPVAPAADGAKKRAQDAEKGAEN